MDLYIVRHAIAEERQSGLDDRDRPLSDEGITKMKRNAAALAAIGAVPDVILCSPLARARQTADILMEAFSGRPALEVIPALAPPANRPDLYEAIRSHERADALMLVGHEPSLGEIAAEILSGSPASYLLLKKGGACKIGIAGLDPAPSGFLHWLMPPAILRLLG